MGDEYDIIIITTTTTSTSTTTTTPTPTTPTTTPTTTTTITTTITTTTTTTTTVPHVMRVCVSRGFRPCCSARVPRASSHSNFLKNLIYYDENYYYFY